MHFTIYLTVKLQKSFNCNFTSIYNSVALIPVGIMMVWTVYQMSNKDIFTENLFFYIDRAMPKNYHGKILENIT